MLGVCTRECSSDFLRVWSKDWLSPANFYNRLLRTVALHRLSFVRTSSKQEPTETLLQYTDGRVQRQNRRVTLTLPLFGKLLLATRLYELHAYMTSGDFEQYLLLFEYNSRSSRATSDCCNYLRRWMWCIILYALRDFQAAEKGR